ncbi:gamma-tubulin complex component 5-like isoform X2 [Apostichopus japonicus]|uniref:gamma-tubulin complex component 5-like isoform X2 n=1 Tax=Stichopus japonicus TaxID=307972 RepID=UPI003AB6CDFE
MVRMAASLKKLEQDSNIEKEAKKLIKGTLNLNEVSENFKRSLHFVLSNFKFHRYLDVNSHVTEKTLRGLYEKFEIHSQPKKAERLQELVQQFLEAPLGKKLDLPRTDTHYAILSVVLNLSETPTNSNLQGLAARQQEDEEEAFDWTSYLLADLPPLKRFADDFPSDEEWSEEEEEEESVLVPLPGGAEGDLSGDESTLRESSMGLSRLSEGVVNEYWKDKEKCLISSGRRAGDIPHDWVASQKRLFSVDRSEVIANVHPLTEDQVVRETLWLLMEPNNGFVYFIKDQQIVRNDRILVSHLTRESLSHLLDEFTEVGNKLYSLQCFIDASFSSFAADRPAGDIHTPPSHCITAQAFGDAIRDFLQDFRHEVLILEKKCVSQDSILTLTTLRDTLQPWFHQIDVVYKVFSKCQRSEVASCCSFVQRMVSEVELSLSSHIQLASTNLTAARTLVVIWMKTMRPYLNFLDHWLTNGTPNNPTGEFSFHRDSNVSVQSDSYWTKSFVLPSQGHSTKHLLSPEDASTIISDSLPLFLKPVYKQILQAGKAMELLHAMGYYVDEFVTRQPGFTLFHDFQEATFQLLNRYHGNVSKEVEEETADPVVDPSSSRSTRRIQDVHSKDPLMTEAFKNVCSMQEALEVQDGGKEDAYSSLMLPEDGFIPPLEILLHRGLNPLILDLCSRINQRLLEVLKEQYHLFKYLSDLKKYFLLEAGDIMNDFYNNLFDDLASCEFVRDVLFENLLNSKLQDTLRSRWSEDSQRLFIIIESKDVLVQGGLFFNSMKLDYKVPWPINLLITPACQEKYNKIYQFLLSVKRVKHCLEEINFKAHLRTIQDGRHQDATDNSHRPDGSMVTPPSLLHQLYLLRFRLLHFVVAVHDYLMTRILHTTSLEFKDSLSSAESLDDLISAHDKYRAMRCLLHPKLSMIREAVVKVLNMAMKFHRKWMLGKHTFSLESLAAMNKEFTNCSFFLSNTLHTVTKKGTFPHLESLSVTIGCHQLTADPHKRRDR